IAGAAWGAWYLASRLRGGASEVAFHRLTFRRGEVRGARLGPDGDTVVYSAAWDGQPTEIYVANRQTPEARSLGIKDAELLSISKSDRKSTRLNSSHVSISYAVFC